MAEHINAQKGIQKIYFSMILLTLCEVSEILEGFFSAGIVSSGMAGEVCEALVLVFMLAALVVQIVGLAAAARDESGYHKAFVISIASTILFLILAATQTIAGNVTGRDMSTMGDFSSILSSVLGIIVDYLVLQTTIRLLSQNHFEDLAEHGRKIWRGILFLFLAAIVIALIQGFMIGMATVNGLTGSGIFASLIGPLLQLVIGGLNILAYAKFRKFLKAAYPRL